MERGVWEFYRRRGELIEGTNWVNLMREDCGVYGRDFRREVEDDDVARRVGSTVSDGRERLGTGSGKREVGPEA
jgi:hypothetical protein